MVPLLVTKKGFSTSILQTNKRQKNTETTKTKHKIYGKNPVFLESL